MDLSVCLSVWRNFCWNCFRLLTIRLQGSGWYYCEKPSGVYLALTRNCTCIFLTQKKAKFPGTKILKKSNPVSSIIFWANLAFKMTLIVKIPDEVFFQNLPCVGIRSDKCIAKPNVPFFYEIFFFFKKCWKKPFFSSVFFLSSFPLITLPPPHFPHRNKEKKSLYLRSRRL